MSGASWRQRWGSKFYGRFRDDCLIGYIPPQGIRLSSLRGAWQQPESVSVDGREASLDGVNFLDVESCKELLHFTYSSIDLGTTVDRDIVWGAVGAGFLPSQVCTWLDEGRVAQAPQRVLAFAVFASLVEQSRNAFMF